MGEAAPKAPNYTLDPAEVADQAVHNLFTPKDPQVLGDIMIDREKIQELKAQIPEEIRRLLFERFGEDAKQVEEAVLKEARPAFRRYAMERVELGKRINERTLEVVGGTDVIDTEGREVA